MHNASTTFTSCGADVGSSRRASISRSTCRVDPTQKCQNAPRKLTTIANRPSAPAPPGAQVHTGASRNESCFQKLHIRAAAAKPIITTAAALTANTETPAKHASAALMRATRAGDRE